MHLLLALLLLLLNMSERPSSVESVPITPLLSSETYPSGNLLAEARHSSEFPSTRSECAEMCARARARKVGTYQSIYRARADQPILRSIDRPIDRIVRSDRSISADSLYLPPVLPPLGHG